MAADRLASVRLVFDQWSRGDFRSTAGLLSDEVESIWGEPPGEDIICHGPAEVATRFAEFLANWSHFRVDADQLIELDADHVLAVATQRGTGTASGVETEARVHIVFKLAGDRIAGTYWFFEREKALRAAGLGPAA